MKKAGLYTRDWFVALVVGLLFLAAVQSGVEAIAELESEAYDAGVRMTYRPPANAGSIAVIAIDDASIQQLGPWPWPRGRLADVLLVLRKARPRAVALLVDLTEPQANPGLGYIADLKQYLAENPLPRNAASQRRTLVRMLAQAENELDGDSKLAKAVARMHNVYLPSYVSSGRSGKPAKPLPAFMRRHRLTRAPARPDETAALFTPHGLRYPYPEFGENAAGIGNIAFSRDSTGGVRSEILALDYGGEYYPSLALLLAARTMNTRGQDIEIEPGKGIKLGRVYIKTDSHMRIHNGFYRGRDGRSPFPTYSFGAVLSGKVPARVFRGKIVLIGLAAAHNAGNKLVTPVSDAMSEPELVANVVASIRNQDFYTRPVWAKWADLGLIAAVLLYLMFMLPSMRATIGVLASTLLLVAVIGGGQYLMVSKKIWLQSASPALLLLLGHFVLGIRRFFTTERLKLAAESDSAETNRLLGLAFQGQGQLDMAMDKFRKLPVDASVLELIYNLALDFERKRQFNKAIAAYDYILRHNSRFRDAAERKGRAEQTENAVMLGTRAANGKGTIILDGVDQKPTLGRYRIERELGRGAMGTVYLGRDPKINRVVAIKTLALQEIEPSEQGKVAERFFREAETAGRLNHPNIVTVYDVGEEHDLAYIAMEYLQGKDLTHYINSGRPVPFDWVMRVADKVADALDYAHKQDVVHRDIKPANIMYNEADDTIKVTDFGIARIIDSTRTKTGIVLGTPSYMSPEQLAGKRVDGRSDLFSLGVTLFELLTGQQPFTGDSLAALMYQIANARPPDVTKLRPDIPACARTVIDRLLQKNPAKRYQSGDELKQAMLKCMGSRIRNEASA